jgi:hypothetical protein
MKIAEVPDSIRTVIRNSAEQAGTPIRSMFWTIMGGKAALARRARRRHRPRPRRARYLQG